MSNEIEIFYKSPDEVLDYGVDWSTRLEVGETITSSSWSVPTGLTLDSDTNDTDSTTAWISGGTLGSSYVITNEIVTSNATPRTYEQSVQIKVIRR